MTSFETPDPDMREQLIALQQNRLGSEAAAALRQRLAAEPQLAALYEAMGRDWPSEAAAASTAAHRTSAKAAREPDEALKTSRASRAGVGGRVFLAVGVDWIIGLAATLVVIVSVAAYAYHQSKLAGFSE
ncbi:MAG: hypothetical protein ACOY3P_11045, partial [Planctomycetota bacterium]